MLDNHATTSSQYFMLALVTVTSLGASIAFGTGGTLPTSVTSADVIITQINGGMNFKQLPKLLYEEPIERYSNWKLSNCEYAELAAYREQHEARNDLDQDHMNTVREREQCLTQQNAALKRNQLIAKIRAQQLETARLLNKMDDFPMEDADYRDTWEYQEGSEDHKEIIDRLKFDPIKKGASNEAIPLPKLSPEQIQSGQYRYFTPHTVECKLCGAGMRSGKPKHIIAHYDAFHPGVVPDIMIKDTYFCKTIGCTFGTKTENLLDKHYQTGRHNFPAQPPRPFIRPPLSRPPSEKKLDQEGTPLGDYNDTPPASPGLDGVVRINLARLMRAPCILDSPLVLDLV